MSEIQVTGQEGRRGAIVWHHTEEVVVDGIRYRRTETGSSTVSVEEAKAAAAERVQQHNFFYTEGEPKSYILCGQCLSDTFHVKCKDTYYPVCSKCGFCSDY